MKKKKEEPLFGHKLEEVIPDAEIRQKFIDQLYKGESIFGEGSIFKDLLQGFVNKALEGEVESHLFEKKTGRCQKHLTVSIVFIKINFNFVLLLQKYICNRNMKKNLLFFCLFFTQFLIGQNFYPPLINIESTYSLGFKKHAKEVTEYVSTSYGDVYKEVYYFNKMGFLIAEETYADNEEGLYYFQDDGEGRHVLEETVYQFNENKLIAIEKSSLKELYNFDDEGFLIELGKAMITTILPYIYDQKGRLIVYSALSEENDEELNYHLYYSNKNEIEYYLMQGENDSVLVFKNIIEKDLTGKVITDINYENSKETTREEHHFENDTLQESHITVTDADGNITRTEWEYNDYGDPITCTQLNKKKGNAFFTQIEKYGYKYEYDEDGTQLKEYHTDDFKNYTLVTERNSEYKRGEKIETIRKYDYEHNLKFETIRTYNKDGELISIINKNIYGEYEEPLEYPEVWLQYTYKRIYTFF